MAWRMRVFFLKYETVPDPNSTHLKKFGSALALCWIDKLTQVEAEIHARNHITQNGWNIIGLQEAYSVSLEDYLPDQPARDFFMRAEKDGEYILYVAGPPENR
jgi:hypothetical protein